MDADAVAAAFAGVRDLATAGVVGGLVMVAMVLPVGHAAANRALNVARASAIIWVLSALGYSLATYAVIRDQPVDVNRFLQEWWQYSQEVTLLQAHLQVMLAAVVTSIVVAVVRTPVVAAWALVPVVWALGWQSLTGHAAGAADHHLAVTAMFMHLAGTALWLGVIGVLAFLRRPLGRDAKAAIMRTSRIALWGAVVVVVSGIANAWVRLTSPTDFFTTTYGRLLVAKIVLMFVAIGLAAWHRRTSLPRLSEAHVQARFWRVLIVDVAALVAVVLVAVVLSTTAPPVPERPLTDPSPAYYLTGYALPPAPSALNWIGLWRLEIITAFAVVVALAVYVRWVLRLRTRGDAWPVFRTAMWILGVATMAWITQGGPAVYGMVTFSGHMVEHMLLVTVAPVFLALGAPVTLALRALPKRADGSRGPREYVWGVLQSRVLKFFAHPLVAAANFAAALILFYYSPAFEFTLRNHAGHLWMVFHFALVGYLFANVLIGIDPGPTRPRYPLRVVLLFATMAAHAFFGVALTSSQVLIAPTWFGLMGRTWGPDAIRDQQYGGQLAWGMGELPVVVLAIAVFIMWRRADDRDARRLDRKADRDNDADLRAYNEMLASIARNDAEGPHR
jgi:cytochrome c oxidase assembly factor CtaG/putative copper export protein